MVILSLLATTIFLLLEQKNIEKKWHTSNNVSILVLIIAAYHYFNMQNKWINNKSNPVIYRYMDWFITVPLLIIEFYVILNVETNIPISIFYKLLIASVLMLLFGFLGELNIIDRVSGFILGSIFWVYIVYQILYGELQQYKKKINNKTVNFIYNNLKWIIIVGWAIYPLGYILNNTDMNLVYNIGDFVNKILYALIIWYGSKYIS
jgi:bacteriorhodopsin